VAIAASSIENRHVRRQRPPSVERNALSQPLERIDIRHTRDLRLVGSFDPVSRMRERGGQLAVVSEQEQSLGVIVQPAHWVDVLADALEQIEHRRPALWIRPGGHVARRLVEEDVTECLRCLDSPPVHADIIHARVGLRPHFSDDRAVDGDAAFRDERLSGAS